MNILQMNNNIVLKNQEDFEPKHIFECGQCFRWDKEKDDSYTIVAFDKVINVSKKDNDIVFKNTNLEFSVAIRSTGKVLLLPKIKAGAMS